MSRLVPRIVGGSHFSVFDDAEFWDAKETDAVPKRAPKVKERDPREDERAALAAAQAKIKRAPRRIARKKGR